MKFILGKKIAMTQVFDAEGRVTPVTTVSAGPCVITQIRTEEKDGYTAVQVGFGSKNKVNKPLKGHLKSLGNFAKLKEFRVEASEIENLKVGQKIGADTFAQGDAIQVTGVSRGMGFAGVVKRHGFHGQDKTHGNKDQLRMPGSIGATGPARVFKGMRMGGQMGNAQVTVKGLEIVETDSENNILYIKGGLPGSRNSYVIIKGDGELKVGVVEVDKKPAEENIVAAEQGVLVETDSEKKNKETQEEAQEKDTKDDQKEAVQEEVKSEDKKEDK